MSISDLKVGDGKVSVEANVKEVGEARTFNKFGRDLRVSNAVIEDESGSIKLSLWNDDVDKVKVGDKVKIVNGYVGEFNGEKQLTTGKFGSLEVVKGDGSESSETPSESIAEETLD